jgi:hypothetical protein
MRSTLPGIGGSLFPSRYLADRLLADVVAPDPIRRDAARRRLQHWWRAVARTCGPATGVRALFDVAAMPLAAVLGFRATSAHFSERAAHVRLDVADRDASTSVPVALIVTPWAHRSPMVWRDAARFARECGADWCLILAAPYLHIVDATGWSRRALEFTFPEVMDDDASFERFWAVTQARAFATADRPHDTLTHFLSRAQAFQHAVREDLQRGVAHSLDALARVLPVGDESLAIVYRVLFLLFAESRELLPWRHPLYGPSYSVSVMCESARADASTPGFWPGLAAVSRLLRIGCRAPEIDVRPFNGHLFARAAAPTLERHSRARGPRARLEDRAVADTLVHLSTRPTRHGRETITYPDLGVEQLGAVYERVLGHPHRKQSGTFYTPRALTEFVVRRTLAPLTRAASADDILRLRVVDPAMGSGAFLVAACRYLARAYERASIAEGRVHEHEIDADMRAEFRRLVAQRCLYGVDRNPVAVQLARLSLWLATLSGGKPLTFLDHRLRTGDALVGARPADLRHVTTRHKQMAMPLFDEGYEHDAGAMAAPLLAMAAEPDDSVDIVRRKEALWTQLNRDDSTWSRWKLAGHLWCARWFTARTPPAANCARRSTRCCEPTQRCRRATFRASARGATTGGHASVLHWPLEFADAFVDADGRPRADAGFDAVIGNPPWEMVRADHSDSAESAQLVRFIRDSGQYPSCARGHVNLYQPFVERALDLTRIGGHVGFVLPWGLASDDGAAALRTRLLDRCRVTTLVGLDNAAAIFPVHRGLRFLALIASPGGRTDELPLIGGVTSASALERRCDADDRLVDPMRISRGLVAMAGGPSRRWPDIRQPRDLSLLEHVTARWPALGSADGWGVEFGRELNVTDDRASFGDRGLPVVEGKHIQPFVADILTPRYRISTSAADLALPGRGFARARLAYRDVSAVSNRQSLIAAIVPPDVVTTHTLFCLRTPVPLEQQHFLCACFNSYVLNAIVRMLMGGHLTTSLVESLPVPPWHGPAGSRRQRLIARLSRRRSRGGAPAEIDATLQALVALEYGITRDAFADLLDTFPLIPDAARQAALAQWEFAIRAA